MMIKIFTLPFQNDLSAFSDEGLRSFMHDKSVLECSEYFFNKDGLPYLVVVLYYKQDGTSSPAPSQHSQSKLRKKADESWKECLTENDLPLFALLKEWRASRAKAEGVPFYIVFSNRELAVLANSRPQSKAQLLEIHGVGEKKVQKYGDELLKMTKKSELNE